MDSTLTSRQISTYTVQIPIYEGPLDLLLQLIEHAELDIVAVSLAQVTEQ
jgi:segregation and condensation protein A